MAASARNGWHSEVLTKQVCSCILGCTLIPCRHPQAKNFTKHDEQKLPQTSHTQVTTRGQELQVVRQLLRDSYLCAPLQATSLTAEGLGWSN